MKLEFADGARIDEVSIQTDEPPGYEAPPGYDEVVKLSHENEVRRRKKHWSNYREPRSRSSPSHSAYVMCSLVSCELAPVVNLNLIMNGGKKASLAFLRGLSKQT